MRDSISQGVFTNIDPPGSRASQAIGINDSGDIVGSYVIGDVSRGFLLSGGVFTRIPNSTIANRINNNKVIVGEYWQNGVSGFIATPTATIPQPADVVSVTPSAGSGTNQPFTATFSNANGFTNISWAMLLFQSSLTGVNACYVQYNLSANILYLVTDDGAAPLGPLTPGSAGIVQNSQCLLNGTGTAVSGSGDTLTLTVNLSFSPAFEGPKNVYLSAQDIHGLNNGDWQLKGTWNPVPTSPQPADVVVVNGASFRRATEPNGAVAPGAIATIFGTDLASSTEVAPGVPLPTTLGETSVTFNGTAAPLFVVSGGQINAQVPFTLLPGEVSVQVNRGSEVSAVQPVTVASVSPGIFTINQQGTGQGAVLIANTATFAAPSGSIPGREAQPVNRLGFISIYCTGLGDVTNRPPSGEPPAVGGQSVSLQTPTVTIGGVEVPVSFSGLTGFVGLYQVNVQVPSEAPTGDAVDVVITIGGIPSNTATIAVQ